jgi:hypothetical protein
VELARALALVDGDVVSRACLRSLGVGSSTIGQAVRDGRLWRLAPGIYATGAEPDLLRAGSELGVLSHRSAARVHGIAILGHPREDVVHAPDAVVATVLAALARAVSWRNGTQSHGARASKDAARA